MPRLILILLLAAAALPVCAERRIAIIVDTSGSMNENDKPRYAAQVSKILTDIVEDQDKVAIIRFPVMQGQDNSLMGRLRALRGAVKQDCNVPADPSLMIKLAGSQREQFKGQIDRLLRYQGPTFFGSPLRDAIPFLGEDSSVQRLLLLVSDAQEGFGDCNAEYTQMVQHFGSTGATVALIKMGGYAEDGFANNPAIQFRQDVMDSRNLISAVAQVYQRFLGSKQVQTGAVSGDIAVDIDEHVKDAFLVVAAETPIGQLQARPGNPPADRVDLDFRSGGETAGVDARIRGYRVVRLTNPSGGHYTFTAPPGTRGGWMLIEEYALVVRMVSQGPVPTGGNATVQLEVVDERTGKRVTDAPTLSKLRLEGKVESTIVTLNNDGSGIFSVEHKFGEPGPAPVEVRLRSGSLDRRYKFSIDVAKNVAKLESQTPGQAKVGEPSPLRVKFVGSESPPDHLVAVIDGRRIELNDKGAGGDEHAGDGVYSGTWTPDHPGSQKIGFEGEGGSVQPIEIEVAVTAPESAPNTPVTPPSGTPVTSAPPPPPPPPVVLAGPGDLSFGTTAPVTLGRLTAESSAPSQITLLNGHVARDLDIEVSTDFDKHHAALEIQTPSGWQTLSPNPLRVHLTANSSLQWPLRLTVAKCPQACKAGEPHKVSFRARRTDGGEERLDVPFAVEIIPDPWYVCWRRELFATMAILAGAILAHGFISPYRFARRVGVQLSPVEDLEEGFFFPLRAARGSGAGFYRDARLFLTEDFRVAKSKRGGFARLRAFRNNVRLRPENGRSIWRQQADGTWEAVASHQDTVARPGVVYRNDQRSLYFEIRTK